MLERSSAGPRHLILAFEGKTTKYSGLARSSATYKDAGTPAREFPKVLGLGEVVEQLAVVPLGLIKAE